MNSHPTPTGRKLGAWLVLSIVLLTVFTAGMTIGYHSVYRHNIVASLSPEHF
jgi:hypothetical protein